MKVFVQSPEQPCRVPLAFDEATAGGITRLRWAVAYISEAGSRELVARLRQQLRGGWDAAEKIVVTSCDYGITEPGAIDFLAGLSNCRVLLSSPEVLSVAGLRPAAAFHPKLCLFDRRVGQAAIVGSANLTVRAFTTNSEAVSLFSSDQIEPPWETAWADLSAGAVEFTEELRARYRAARARNGGAIDIDPPFPPNLAVPVGLPVFFEEVQAGRLDPGGFRCLWVEAGAMASSASHNQLELPRAGNRFFGFAFNQYHHDREEIGYPVLFVRGRPFRDRKLVWHGGTGMERVYLPTEAQSGLHYQGQLILFRQTRGGFDVGVFPWGGTGAAACRAASERVRRVYQLGWGSDRICGVY